MISSNLAGPDDGTGVFKLWTREANAEWILRVDSTGATMVNQREFSARGEMKCGMYPGMFRILSEAEKRGTGKLRYTGSETSSIRSRTK